MNRKNEKLKKQLKKHSGGVVSIGYEQAKRRSNQAERILHSASTSADMKARAQEILDQEQRIVARVLEEMQKTINTVSLHKGL